MATHTPTTGQEAHERSRLLIAPGGPVSRAVAVMGAHNDIYSPQFTAGRLDHTAITIGASCMACWLAPATLWFGDLL